MKTIQNNCDRHGDAQNSLKEGHAAQGQAVGRQLLSGSTSALESSLIQSHTLPEQLASGDRAR